MVKQSSGITFANKITIGRILIVPVFIATVLYYKPQDDHYRLVALVLFLLAAVMDVIDGYVARTRQEKTQAGAILDPLADKFLLMGAFICLYKVGVHFDVIRFPIWLVVTVISRDVILLIGAMLLFLINGFLDIQPSVWGRFSTFFQSIAVIGMLLQWSLSWVFWYCVVAFAAISGVDYIWKGIKVLNSAERKI